MEKQLMDLCNQRKMKMRRIHKMETGNREGEKRWWEEEEEQNQSMIKREKETIRRGNVNSGDVNIRR